jgi:hypothetical protein
VIKSYAALLTILLFLVAWSPVARAAETTLVGSSAVETQADSSSAGTAEAFSQTATASGTAETARLYIGASNAAKTVVVGIYSNVSAHPGTLLSTGSATATAAGTWTSVPIGPVAVTSGATYWLAILGEGGTLRYQDHAKGACASESSSQDGMTALASTWKTGTGYKDCPGSVYVTAEVAPSPPVNTALPAVSGVAEEGSTLTSTAGAWSGSPTSYAYQWQDCNSAGDACSSIGAATASSYRLAASDVGHTVRVVVTATNTVGSTPASSAATAVVVAGPVAPVNTALPVISGSDEEGQTLSASAGSWSGSPTSVAYQWEDCNALGEGCLSVSGSTAASLKLTSLNVGGTVRVSVTAANAKGSASATSAATPMIKAAPPVEEDPSGEPVLLIGVKTTHHYAGDAKTEEITPVKFEAKKSGTVEEICFETGGYLYPPSETSLILAVEEDIGGKPGKVLGQGTYVGTLGMDSEAKVTGLKVSVTKGKTYFLTFLNLGGSITYWYEKTETVIYSQHHKILEEGPPEDYEWKEEAAEAPIGIWAKGRET